MLGPLEDDWLTLPVMHLDCQQSAYILHVLEELLAHLEIIADLERPFRSRLERVLASKSVEPEAAKTAKATSWQSRPVETTLLISCTVIVGIGNARKTWRVAPACCSSQLCKPGRRHKTSSQCGLHGEYEKKWRKDEVSERPGYAVNDRLLDERM